MFLSNFVTSYCIFGGSSAYWVALTNRLTNSSNGLAIAGLVLNCVSWWIGESITLLSMSVGNANAVTATLLRQSTATGLAFYAKRAMHIMLIVQAFYVAVFVAVAVLAAAGFGQASAI